MAHAYRARRAATRLAAAGLICSLLAAPALSQTAAPLAPAAFAVSGRTTLLAVHAEGAQIYDCRADAAGALHWVFREPIATLIRDGLTVGRHYAGPNWELADGARVKGKAAASAPGAAPGDVPLLKLDVVEHGGGGALTDATLVLRLNTHGGALQGGCPRAGELRAEPYSADYVFLR